MCLGWQIALSQKGTFDESELNWGRQDTFGNELQHSSAKSEEVKKKCDSWFLSPLHKDSQINDTRKSLNSG